MQGEALYLKSTDDRNLRDVIARHKPSRPLYVVDLDKVKDAVASFNNAFSGTSLFAVKVNPDARIIAAAAQAGIRAFDVASLSEINTVHGICPNAQLHFMHPVKSPEDIRAAYHDYNVRHFVLDHADELYKIMRETELAQDLNLTVRVALPKNESAKIDFSSKFGASYQEAIELLKKCRPISQQLAISFHVGTQTVDATRYQQGVEYCANLIDMAAVEVDAINIGGGFPVTYTDQPDVPSVKECIAHVNTAIARRNLSHVNLYAEPGRVLVAESVKLVARVELRKGDVLYINDGVYGGLFDAASWLDTRYPVSAMSCDRPFDGNAAQFRLAGPTCDSIDMMSGPFILPADIGMGDWVVFSHAGAYSQCLRSDFNGFGASDIIYL